MYHTILCCISRWLCCITHYWVIPHITHWKCCAVLHMSKIIRLCVSSWPHPVQKLTDDIAKRLQTMYGHITTWHNLHNSDLQRKSFVTEARTAGTLDLSHERAMHGSRINARRRNQNYGMGNHENEHYKTRLDFTIFWRKFVSLFDFSWAACFPGLPAIKAHILSPWKRELKLLGSQ